MDGKGQSGVVVEIKAILGTARTSLAPLLGFILGCYARKWDNFQTAKMFLLLPGQALPELHDIKWKSRSWSKFETKQATTRFGKSNDFGDWWLKL